MALGGGCYCGELRYEAAGEPFLRAQCHCRACQHITGGAPNFFMLMQPEGFRYVKGAPKTFKRPDLPNAVTREFCANCGTHIATHRPGLKQIVLKAGTLDDPDQFRAPQIAIFTAEKACFHDLPAGLPAFEGLPPQR